MDEQNKLDAFRHSMTAQAEADIARMNREMDTLRADAKHSAQVREEAGEDSCVRAAREQAEQAVQSKATRAALASRRKLLQLREALTETLFCDVRASLASFTASPAYAPYLLACAKRLRTALPQEDAVLYLRAADMGYADALCTVWRGNVLAERAIALGGAQARSEASGLLADETLDARVREQYEWFRANAGAVLMESVDIDGGK